MQWYLRPVGRIGRSWLLPKGFSHGRSGTVTLPSSLSPSAPLTDPSIVWEFLAKTATHNKSNTAGSPSDAATHNCMAGGGGADNLPSPPAPSRRCRVASAAGHSVNTTEAAPVKLVRFTIVPVRFLTRSPLIMSPRSSAKIKGENMEGQIRLGFQLLNAKACPAQCTFASSVR